MISSNVIITSGLQNDQREYCRRVHFDMPKGQTKGKKQVVPYARGYRPPSSKRCHNAITHPIVPVDALPLYLQPLPDFYHPIPPPTSIDDWLAQYNESGQSYRQFINECPWLSKRRWKQIKQTFVPEGTNIREKYPEGAIYLLRLGNFDKTTSGLSPRFEALVEYVKVFYGLPVQILEGLDLQCEGKNIYLVELPNQPTSDCKDHKTRISLRKKRYLIESRHNSKTGHIQLRVQSILLLLKSYIPSNALFVMALTMYDLFEAVTDLFVAGMAAGNHRVGVFSFLRYDPTCEFSVEFWYDLVYLKSFKKEVGQQLILQRSCKLIVHEIAHLLGVDHCIWYECCMNGSGHLEEDFRQPMFLCPVDLHKLQVLCGFNVVQRYGDMKTFFQKYNLVEEKLWIEKRLAQLKEYSL